jgi:hypothetical protein
MTTTVTTVFPECGGGGDNTSSKQSRLFRFTLTLNVIAYLNQICPVGLVLALSYSA